MNRLRRTVFLGAWLLLTAAYGCDGSDSVAQIHPEASGSTGIRSAGGPPDNVGTGPSSSLTTGAEDDGVSPELTARYWLPLIEPTSWRELPPALDPFVDHRPVAVKCPPSAWYVEFGALEVETGYCNYINLQQASLLGVEAGRPLRLVIWHEKLIARDPSMAHVAVWTGGQVLWDALVDIPTQADVYDLTFAAPVHIPMGQTLVFHLHNHGYNTWKIAKLDLGVP